MDSATQHELNAINRRFYAAIAPEWSDKRKHPWPGWRRVCETFESLRPAAESGSARVLDLGCGDGRLARYLATRAFELDYLGIDASAELLARAREATACGRFLLGDFLRTPLHELTGPDPFALCCVFGVLHHVPARARREQLVHELARRLDTPGLLALSFWRLDEDPRFASRRLSIGDYNARAARPLALDQLEPGDTLLSWGDAAEGAPPRYCHFPDPSEIAALVAASGLRELARFRADGHLDRMNEYVLLTNAPA